jgi:hypothetical protein
MSLGQGGKNIMKKITVILFVGVFLAVAVSSAYAVETTVARTEVRLWNPDKAYNGYTIFTPQSWDTTYLIDMGGNVVNEWPETSNPKLLENGNVWGGMEELDWDGNIVWEWDPDLDSGRPNIGQHHDSWKIFNPKLGKMTALALTRYDVVTNAEIYAAGGDPSIDYENGRFRGDDSRLDGLAEVDMESGEIIWEWKFHDHTIQDRNAAWPNHVGGLTIADFPGKADVFWKTDQANSTDNEEGIIRDWHHCNAIDYNEELDLIAINAKHWSEFYVIDHGATFIAGDPAGSTALAAGPAGDYIYRFGNPSAYGQGVPPGYLEEGNQQMYGAHNIQWIKDAHYTGGPALPGAGNFLIFMNGNYHPMTNHSEILEINPYLDAAGFDTGSYVNPPDADYTDGINSPSNQIVWSFASEMPNSFYGRHVSSAQRLPNGNTLIDSGTQGHFLEVTEDGEVVWDYISPVFGRGNPPQIEPSFFDFMGRGNTVFRAYRYGPDYPGLKGKNLVPQGTLTGRVPLGSGDELQTPLTGFGFTGMGIGGGGATGGAGEGGVGGY